MDHHEQHETTRFKTGSSSQLGDGLKLFDSPGSSVFDLPVHNDPTPSNELAVPADRRAPAMESSGHIKENNVLARRDSKDEHSFIVISGGTGCNSICSAFGDACYVLPVSDDGGSSSEIIRVLGGPSIGDIRSRLIRLIPYAPPGSPLDRIRNLLAYRLSPEKTEQQAREEWRDIVEGRSTLWSGIPPDRKEVIRGFLVYFESEVLRRAQKNFSFRNGSIGNYFLAAARIFFRSLPSAIFLFSSITTSQACRFEILHIPGSNSLVQANILPVLVTNHTVTIAVELENARTIVGQCNISHPTDSSSFSFTLEPTSPIDGIEESTSARRQNIAFSKDADDEMPLESRINRLFYINAHGHEIHPTPNPDFLHNCATRDVLVYSCGSLWTSVMPCLALREVASAIARSRTLKAKILLLNSRNDRETGGYSAAEYIRKISRTLNAQDEGLSPYTLYPTSAFITHMVYLTGGSVDVNVEEITAMGVSCVEIESSTSDAKGPLFDANCVDQAVQSILREEKHARASQA